MASAEAIPFSDTTGTGQNAVKIPGRTMAPEPKNGFLGSPKYTLGTRHKVFRPIDERGANYQSLQNTAPMRSREI